MARDRDLAALAKACDLIREHRHAEFGGTMPDSVFAGIIESMGRYGGRTVGTLTNRQREVLALLLEGMSARQIAAQLYISRHTVGNHLAAIYRVLGVHNRAEAIVAAYNTPAA